MMKRLLTYLWGLGLALTVFGAVRSAHAQSQPWLEDRRGTRGIGIRSGDLEIHPGVAGEVGYDSNYFQASGDPGEPEIPTLRLRITPSISLETLGQERKEQDGETAAPPQVNFRTRAALILDRLFSLDSDYTDGVNSRTDIGATVDANLNVLPERPWGADFQLGFVRVAQPYNEPGTFEFDRNTFAGGADVRWRPGAGVLQWTWGYGARLTLFDDASLGLDRVEHDFRMTGSWRFLPRTAMLYRGNVGMINRTNEDSRLPNGMPVSSMLGVNGLFTSRLGLLAMAGYKAIFFEPDEAGNEDEFDAAIGRAELAWFIKGRARLDGSSGERGFSTLRVGFIRDGFPSDFSNHYTVNKPYAKLEASIGGAVYLELAGGVAFITHAMPRDQDGTALAAEAPKELRPDASLFAEYRIGNTIGIFANGAFSASPTENLIDVGDGTTDNLEYTRITALLGVRWFM